MTGSRMTATASVTKRRGAGPLMALTATQGLSAAGVLMTLTALTVSLQGRENGPLLVTVLIAASLVPGILIGPAISHLLVHFDAATVLKAGLLARSLTILGLSFTSDTAAILVLFLVASSASVLENPALLTLAPAVKPAGMEVPKVYARLALSRNLGAITGPVAAGILVAAGSVHLALILDAGSSLVLAAVVHLSRLHAPTTEESSADHGLTSKRSARSSVKQLLHEGKGVGASVWMLALAILFTAALPVAQAEFMLTDLALGPALYGAVLASYSAGRIGASLLASLATVPVRATTLLTVACLLMGAALVTAALLPLVPVVFAAFFLAGAANTQQVLSIRTIIHDATPQAQLGRTFTALGAVNNSATLVGVIIGGAVAGITSGAISLLIAGTGTVTAILVVRLLQYRRHFQPTKHSGRHEDRSGNMAG